MNLTSGNGTGLKETGSEFPSLIRHGDIRACRVD